MRTPRSVSSPSMMGEDRDEGGRSWESAGSLASATTDQTMIAETCWNCFELSASPPSQPSPVMKGEGACRESLVEAKWWGCRGGETHSIRGVHRGSTLWDSTVSRWGRCGRA